MLEDFAIATAWRDDWVAVQVAGVVTAERIAPLHAAVRRAAGRRVRLDLTRALIDAPGFMASVGQWQEAFARNGRVLSVVARSVAESHGTTAA
jgi:hypothetical protein